MNTVLLFSDAFVRALGWALAHSLWQATLAALLLWALLPRLRSAAQRYRAAFATLLGLFLGCGLTLCWVFLADAQDSSPLLPSAGAASSDHVFWIENQGLTINFWEKCTRWMEANSALVVAVWLLGFALFLLRLGGGLWQLHGLRTRKLRPLDGPWPARLADIQRRMGLHRAVSLCESALVQAPLALGWLKPLILLPVGMVNQLSSAEVEAVLAHELAHIARHDWALNLLQAFIEAVFYYHPAVWWVSGIIRQERENCCDDLALSATGNPLAFAKALVRVQELATPAPMLALGMHGNTRRRPLLLERVRRILNQPQQKSQVMEKFTATVLLLALLALVGLRANNTPSIGAAFAQMSDLPSFLFEGQYPENQVFSDSIPRPKGKRRIVREDDRGKVELEMKDGNITRLRIDDTEVPASEYDKHRALTQELLAESAPPPPPPPPPGFPAQPGRWFEAPEAPAAPALPEGVDFPEAPPPPPFPLRQKSYLSTTKDKEGNTIIQLKRQGSPMEIVVKDGQVWVNGDKLEDGEKIDLSGLDAIGFNFDGLDPEGLSGYHFGGYHSSSGEGPALAFDLEDLGHLDALAELRAQGQQMRWQYDEHFKAQREALLELEKLSAKEGKTLSKKLKKEYKRLEKEIERERENLKKEMEAHEKAWRAEQKLHELAAEQYEREQAQYWNEERPMMARAEAQNRVFQEAIRAELLRDGLLKDPKNIRFEISAKALVVNGQKQSAELHRKYLGIFERAHQRKIGDLNYIYNEQED
jgi:beta-lactamase regulating signal transducer with metallopeptidase domain